MYYPGVEAEEWGTGGVGDNEGEVGRAGRKGREVEGWQGEGRGELASGDRYKAGMGGEGGERRWGRGGGFEGRDG